MDVILNTVFSSNHPDFAFSAQEDRLRADVGAVAPLARIPISFAGVTKSRASRVY
jgi:hypothetical protein